MIAYETRLDSDLGWALREGSMHFEKESAVHKELEGRGYLPRFQGSKHLRDTELGVRIKFLVAGQYPGDGKEKPVTFPDPSNVAVSMKILFLHGWQSVPGGVKPTYLAQHGHEVINPKLPDEDFTEAVCIAQAAFDKHRPEVVVGSSRGGAVAMNIDSGDTRLVLLCPAWKKWGTVKNLKPGTVVLHGRADEVVPFADSEELVRSSGLAPSALVEVGCDHRLADPEPLEALLKACRKPE